MFAAHRDQENFVHEQQTVAAAKPLNQGVRGLAPKTPGNNVNKAKVPLKSGGKGDENNTLFAGKTSKANRDAFVTPIAPRGRAPLGAKTTNAKATAFQTPAPLTGGQGLQKTQRSSARKHKLKIHQPEVIEAEPISKEDDEDDIPEIEYCPPKITELPDIPDDPNAFGPDKTFPQFQGDNMCRGWYSIYCNPVGEDGLTRDEREMQKCFDEAREWGERTIMESVEQQMNELSARVEERESERLALSNASKQTRKAQGTRVPPSTINAKAAALALSNKPQPSYAAPTAAAKARNTNGPPSIAKRNTAAHRGTIGYSNGRKVSSDLRQQRQAEGDPVKSDGDSSRARLTKKNDLLDRLVRQSSEDEDDDEELDFGSGHGTRDLFFEEACRPYVLQLPDYGQ